MEITTWITYTGIITALILFPGPSSLLVTLHGYHYGVKRCNYTISGNSLGSFVLMLLSVLGLGVVINSSEQLFMVVKYIGASYLIYLGINTWKKSSTIENNKDLGETKDKSSYGLFSQGFLTGLSNPKDLIFFAALFPSFLDLSAPLPTQFMLLMSTWLVVDYFVKLIYAFTGRELQAKLSSPDFLNTFNKVTGGIFVILGIVLAASNKVQDG